MHQHLFPSCFLLSLFGCGPCALPPDGPVEPASTTSAPAIDPTPESASAKITTKLDTGKPFWVAGTPWWVHGEGYTANYQVAPTPDGPWDLDHLEEVRGAVKLVPGQVHRVRATRERSRQADAAETFLHVKEVLESRPGGPPVVVHPGVSMNGVLLADRDLSPDQAFGPIRVVATDPEPRLRVWLADVGSVKIGDVLVRDGIRFQDLATRLEGCGQPSRQRGATTIDCHGVALIGAGPVPDANIGIVVVLPPPAVAAQDAACRIARDCWSALGEPPSDGKWDCIDRKCQLSGSGPFKTP